jgi:uncharacterized repeat protein (TIGR03803 family)
MKTELKSATARRVAVTVRSTNRIQHGLRTCALAVVLGFTAFATLTAQAQTLTTLHTFCSTRGCKDGIQPSAGLVMDANGNLYGTTFFGGRGGSGTIFKIDAKGKESVLYSFKGSPDAGFPLYAPLMLDAKGNLYGTSAYGGKACSQDELEPGCGTVFKINAKGKETVLHRFKGGMDGTTPMSRLIMDAEGNLYGTTTWGGSGNCPTFPGCGIVFELDTKRKETILHTFDASTGDGAFPSGDLVTDAAGNLYGTTAEGGANGYGTVFKLSTSGQETIVYSFQSGADGAYPEGLLSDSEGNLYGTTGGGGVDSFGVVFKVDTSGSESVLYTFNYTDGAVPSPGMILIADAAGNLYGTTQEGAGPSGGGTVFKLEPSGNESVLYSFCSEPGCTDGTDAVGNLVMDGKGNLYGVTENGGSGVNPIMGTVFKLTP